jgi:hypothetical protein
MVLAFSLQSDVKSIGAYAGFAAIIGLALLVLLYFAQAREVRRMADLLEEQEDRLRSLPASARQLTPRPVLAPPGREVPTPPLSAAQPASAASTATVAVPGARRVAVGGAAAGAVPALGPAGALGEVGEPGKAAVPVAAATVAGAIAAASAAPAAIPGVPPADAPMGAPPAADDVARAGRPDAAPTTGTPGSGGAGSGDPSTPSASVPLSAPPAATAEPVGSAQRFDGAPAAADELDDVSPDTAETAIVEGSATGQSAESESAEALGAGAVAVAAVEPEPAGEISAERLESSVFDFTAEPAPGPARDDDDQVDRMPAAQQDEPPPLAPSTAAGARPRFPPPPPQARALPVAAAAAVGGVALEGVGTDGGAATTRRRERPPSTDGEDLEPHAGGSVFRLLAAAVVIVAVLIFIATKVFSTGSPPAKTRPPGPVPATITVAVLNGTHASGLASQVSTSLSGLGFKRGFVGNALSHGHHVTLVGYTAPADLAAAKEVAKDLGNNTRVGPADAATKGLAEAQVGAIPDVIVTLGSEYAAR